MGLVAAWFVHSPQVGIREAGGGRQARTSSRKTLKNSEPCSPSCCRPCAVFLAASSTTALLRMANFWKVRLQQATRAHVFSEPTPGIEAQAWTPLHERRRASCLFASPFTRTSFKRYDITRWKNAIGTCKAGWRWRRR
jgi:hypothetical protein